MAPAIDLPTLSQATGIPHATLRYWTALHALQPIDKLGPRKSGRYLIRDLKPMLLAWNERREAA